ncbi:MAG: cell division protein CrgA [bacterium]|nr:cell division protein CrgA [bacterium]
MPQSKGRRKRKTAGRPTPPKSAASRGKKAKESSKLYVAVMFGLMALGVLMVVTRYVLDTPSWLLLVGLASMGGGFLMTTNYH